VICSWTGYARQLSTAHLEVIHLFDNNFLTQMIKESTRREALLVLMLTNKEELVRDVKVG